MGWVRRRRRQPQKGRRRRRHWGIVRDHERRIGRGGGRRADGGVGSRMNERQAMGEREGDRHVPNIAILTRSICFKSPTCRDDEENKNLLSVSIRGPSWPFVKGNPRLCLRYLLDGVKGNTGCALWPRRSRSFATRDPFCHAE